jgi:hypothetical protein
LLLHFGMGSSIENELVQFLVMEQESQHHKTQQVDGIPFLIGARPLRFQSLELPSHSYVPMHNKFSSSLKHLGVVEGTWFLDKPTPAITMIVFVFWTEEGRAVDLFPPPPPTLYIY